MTDNELINKLRSLRAALYNPPVPALMKGAVQKVVSDMGIVETIDACIERISK